MASKAEKDIAKDDQLISGELYKALMKDDVEKVIGLCERIDEHALHVLTIHKDTVLHKATFAKQAILVLRLLEALPPLHLDKMTRKNDVGNTILHEAATLDTENSVEVATKMLEKAPELLSMANNLGETALFRAARYGKTKIFNFLADKIKQLDEVVKQEFIQRDDKTTILHSAILSQHFGLAMEIAKKFGHIIDERDEDGMTALQLLSCNYSAFETVRKRGLLQRIYSSVEMYCSSARSNDGVKEKSRNESALELAKLLVKKDTSWELTSSASDLSKTKPHRYGTSGGDEKGGSGEGLSSSISTKSAEAAGSGEELSSSIYPKPAEAASSGDTPLFIATKFGCIEIVKEILKTYPQAVEHIDDDGRTILHVAIKYRQLEVFELVLKQEVAKRWLVRRLDNKGNSILHMAGVKRSDHVYVPEKLRGPALELQDEMLWFERVKAVTKASFIDHRNKRKDTAEALFSNTNKDLRNEAREWLKKTAEGCSIVAVLIATVAFAAAYTIPGGPNQNTGLPVLLYQPFFVVFTATDVLSLACALTSVVIFLSILTSPFRMVDFKHSLPNKLMLGFTFLFLSVSMMMISFAATILLIIRGKQSWTKVVLYALSFLPVGIFALSYIPLYISLSRTYQYLLEKITQAIPWSKWLPDFTKHKPEREDLYSLAAPQTSHLSV